VDDIVQDAMIRIPRGVRKLESPAAYRSWAVAITMNQVRDHRRARAAAPAADALDEATELPDPAAEFAGAAVLGVELSGQRAETVRATGWLDGEDRDLLALWWLETAGQLGRAETAAAPGLTGHQVAVRVQRMKERLRTARLVVRALAARPRCARLSRLTLDWDGRPGGLWRKRLGRHVRECLRCAGDAAELLYPERLLAPYALLPVPVGLLAARWWLGAGHVGAAGPGAGAGSAGSPGSAGGTGGTASAGLAVGKLAVAAVALLAVGGGALLTTTPWHHHPHPAVTAGPRPPGCPAPAPGQRRRPPAGAASGPRRA
jgi:DNA-directed RNA polymerase specialized sigma24 family protein